ncbi:hypothetical protein RJ55_03584 [Drechmeria coniospora]|nr:hypothetical protein RJ55_03584 [Drechmeria coniospora]
MSSTPVFTPDEPGALGLDEILSQVAQDDEDEWEYEYSTTETETYYLTVELSYTEFKEQSKKMPHHSRGGYYKNWLDQTPAGPSKKVTRGKAGNDGDGSDDENEAEPDAGADGDDDEDEEDDDNEDAGPPLDPGLQAASKGLEDGEKAADKQATPRRAGDNDDGEVDGGEEGESFDEIQVLELHSHRPVISYRGRVFEGQWAEVIGTEAILTKHKEQNPLPALRNLKEGVDFLAASSARIMTTEKVPKPRAPEQDSLAAIREEWNIRIPPGKDRTGERAQQIRFLENLIALKMKREDMDQVTVYATDGDGKDWDDKQGPDFKPRIRRKAAARDDSTQSASAARARGQSSGSDRHRARSRRQARGGRGASAAGMGSTSALSTPTPSRWDDLPQPSEGLEGEEDDDDEGGEDASMTGND